jgi:polyisoprenoid-binding protein YceI
MKKTSIIFSILFTLCCCFKAHSQLFMTSTGETSFYSKTPLEDISALNKQVITFLNTANGEIAVKIQNTAFHFPNKLMEEHFNENYMESSKFPSITFKGKIKETIDFKKLGAYNVTAIGSIDMHGVKKENTLIGVLTIEKEKISLKCDFDVKLVDYKIDIPTLVVAKIAESIKIKTNFILLPKAK